MDTTAAIDRPMTSCLAYFDLEPQSTPQYENLAINFFLYIRSFAFSEPIGDVIPHVSTAPLRLEFGLTAPLCLQPLSGIDWCKMIGQTGPTSESLLGFKIRRDSSSCSGFFCFYFFLIPFQLFEIAKTDYMHIFQSPTLD